VPGHGHPCGCEEALAVLEQDIDYLIALQERGIEAELPPGRRTGEQRRIHQENLERVTDPVS
jgi:hypothetical protein